MAKELLHDIIKETNTSQIEALEQSIKQAVKKELEQRLAKLTKVYPNSTKEDLEIYKEFFIEGIEESITLESPEAISEDIATKVDEVIASIQKESKLEAIPEELKGFLTEDGAIDEDKLTKVNTAVATAEKKEAYEAFLGSEFVKGIKDADVTMEKFEEVSAFLGEDKLAKVIAGEEVAGLALIAPSLVKVEEVKEEEVTEKSAFEAVVETMEEEEAVKVNSAMDEAVNEIITAEKDRAREAGTLDLFEQKVEAREAEIRAALEADFR